MIRKWSYINKNFLLTKNPALKLKSRFKVKVFRKNTRFKNLNQGNTLFIRKLVVLRHRRVGWKPYFVAASLWAKYLLKSKKFITFLQTKLLHKFTVTYPYLNLFFKKTNLTALIGIGRNSINYVFSKSIVNKKTLLPTAQFNTLNKANKLSKLGFNFINLKFLKHQLPLKINTTDTINLYFSWKLTLNQVLSIRAVHTYLILKFINM